ncbi:MAG TPA: glycerol-3-phosphate 1-O-acyltransferase PlsY [Thermotogota bacterium]|nr:glycerol-3-phosphate 1-O-acyltransferase PlsY [Thermotogota bacterium]HPJ88233.1 glycerol-3-phosphate 1-O-acyltransferase PlsY [Thermotogota bacterium]HPR96082.1 glycerol-3-phosphate 1-O-acyltransferase PlsY [Thermotogota bacterium]
MINIFYVVLLYICGSIPFSYIVPMKMKGIDIRTVGSGNIGATNVLRGCGLKIGIVCLILDALKAFIPLMLMRYVFIPADPNLSVWLSVAAFAAILGHDFSIFMKFAGGKGVSSTMGVFFAIHPISGLVFFTLGLTIALTTRVMSLASIVAMMVATICIFFLVDQPAFWILYICMTLFSVYRHRGNIRRLIKGNENKFM